MSKITQEEIDKIDWLDADTYTPKHRGHNKWKNESGNKYGTLTVSSKFCRRIESHYLHWLCYCECGNKCLVSSYSLRKYFRTISCGCALASFIRNRSYKGNDYLSGNCIYSIVRGAKARKIKCPSKSKLRNIIQQLGDKQKCLCDICGHLMNKRISKQTNLAGLNGISLDRINSNLGYDKIKNLRLVCRCCNTMRINMTDKELFERVKRIYEYNNLGAK